MKQSIVCWLGRRGVSGEVFYKSLEKIEHRTLEREREKDLEIKRIHEDLPLIRPIRKKEVRTNDTERRNTSVKVEKTITFPTNKIIMKARNS